MRPCGTVRVGRAVGAGLPAAGGRSVRRRMRMDRGRRNRKGRGRLLHDKRPGSRTYRSVETSVCLRRHRGFRRESLVPRRLSRGAETGVWSRDCGAADAADFHDVVFAPDGAASLFDAVCAPERDGLPPPGDSGEGGFGTGCECAGGRPTRAGECDGGCFSCERMIRAIVDTNALGCLFRPFRPASAGRSFAELRSAVRRELPVGGRPERGL